MADQNKPSTPKYDKLTNEQKFIIDSALAQEKYTRIGTGKETKEWEQQERERIAGDPKELQKLSSGKQGKDARAIMDLSEMLKETPKLPQDKLDKIRKDLEGIKSLPTPPTPDMSEFKPKLPTPSLPASAPRKKQNSI